MDKLEPIYGILLIIAFVYLVIWTIKVFNVALNEKRKKRIEAKMESIRLRTIGVAKNYWYNKQDVEDRPENRSVESYYHYFNEAKDCIKDLIIEMYDCGLVRTEMLEAIAYSGGMVGKEAKDFVQKIHNGNVVAAIQEKKNLVKQGGDKDTIKIPVVDWDLEDILEEQLAEAEKREKAEAFAADMALKEAEKALKVEKATAKKTETAPEPEEAVESKKEKSSRKSKKKTARTGKERLEQDKKNRILKEQIDAEDEEFDKEFLDDQEKEDDEKKPQGDPEVAKQVMSAMKEHEKEKAASDGETEDLSKKKKRGPKKSADKNKITPMTKAEKAEFEKKILIQTAVYESWVSYVFQLYEIININANEEIRNQIREALMEYGRNDVEVLLHSPE